MLVLSLKVNESIVIGPDVRVMVTSVRPHGSGYKVKLGIDAPKHVGIVRSELLEERSDERFSEEGRSTGR